MNCKKCAKKLRVQLIRVDGKVISTKLLPCDCDNLIRNVTVNVYGFIGFDKDSIARELSNDK